MGPVPYEHIGSVGTNNGKILEPMTKFLYLKGPSWEYDCIFR